MKRKLLALAVVVALAVEPAQVIAQVNNNEYTPLGSRIRKSQQFPNEPRSTFRQPELNEAQRARSRTWVDILGRCMWDRSNEKGIDLLKRTDFGFRSFEQIEIKAGEVDKFYPVSTCMERVAARANSGMMLRFSAAGMRSWYLQAAYFDAYKDGPTWVKPGYVVEDRAYPSSQNDESVQAAMNLADCVVSEDPYGADYFFRTAPGTAGEDSAIQNLGEPLSACIPQGQQVSLDRAALRTWIGEGLWHAANHTVALPAETASGPAAATLMVPLNEQESGQ